MSVLRNLGNGTFAAAVSYPAGAGPSLVASPDLNGDGKPDLVVTSSIGPSSIPDTVSVLRNLGDGTFAVADIYATSKGPSSIAVVDLNSDGQPDLAVACSSGSVSVLLNVGGGAFAPASSYASGTGALSVAAADLNADGRADLVTANSGVGGDNVSVLFNTCVP